MPKHWYLIIVFALPVLIILQSAVHRHNQIDHRIFQLDDQLRYDMSAPVETHDLPAVLNEISGLSYLPSGELIAVEDEHGICYTITTTGQLIDTRKFATKEDFEGVEWINDSAFAAINSKGDVYFVEIKGDSTDCAIFNTPLKRDDDIEGLSMNRANNQLLLATKAHSKEGYKKRRIYAFDLETQSLLEDPLVKISNDSLWHFFGKSKKRNLSPSALAYYAPDFILLSSADHLIVRIDSFGNTISAARLDPSIYIQPEGLAIGPNGSLYISSEGQNASAQLFRLEPIQ